MYVIKNNEKIPIEIEDDAIVEHFTWKSDWPLVVGISLAVIFVILLIIFLSNSGAHKKTPSKSSYSKRYR